ncbi:MAG: hypothetical protein Q8920_01240 [Bacillota bacterium]|nr:hypothetical protein [Bacillota bacterium]
MDQNRNNIIESLTELEKMEKDKCSLPLIFAEVFKDEMNANEEHKLYNGFVRLIHKYSEDKKSLDVINEYTRVISGGTSLEEILQVTKDEAAEPTVISDIVVDNSCSRQEEWDKQK